MKGNINPEYSLEVRKIIGSWLKQMRIDKSLSQEELADQMGIGQTTISKIEDGKWNFGVDTITLFAQHLDFYLFFVPKNSDDDLAKSMRDRWEKINNN